MTGKTMQSTFSTRRPTRRGANAALLAFFGAAAMAVPALAQSARDPGAEAFVQTKAERVIAVLADKKQSEAQKKQVFRQAVDELADVPKITNFVLGKYARTITPDQRARFTPVFRAYAENVYQSRIDDYRGEQLKVTGSVVRDSATGDVVVKVVNGEDRAFDATVVLAGAATPTCHLTAAVLTGASPDVANADGQPPAAVPVVAESEAGATFLRAFPANSLTILRLRR